MQKVALFAHGGSGNHGCEAIVRGMVKQLRLSAGDLLLSNRPDEDINYGVDKLLTIRNSRTKVWQSLWYKVRAKISGNSDRFFYQQLYKNLPELVKGFDVAYSIGGDNYCYRGMDMEMMVMRQLVAKSGVNTILYGCSVEPEFLSEEILEDMKQYDSICCRESLTYQELLSHGFTNLQLKPDPAFYLGKKIMPLSDKFLVGNTIGVNVSPLIIHKGVSSAIVLKNYANLINYIIERTPMNVALIPHVVWEHNNDMKPLSELYKMFDYTNRIELIADCTAEELKGYIARCRFLVAARTHASIAGYSTGVPTLVLGYSVKSRGIARDIFGDERDYVLSVSELWDEDSLTRAFMKLMERETEIRSIYNKVMSVYLGN